MLNEVVKGLKRTKTDWLSPNLSEPVRAVRTADEMAKHRHAIHSGYALNSNNMSEYNEDHYRFQKWGAGLAGWQLDGLKGTNFVGGDTPHNNVPPSLAGYAWRRQQ